MQGRPDFCNMRLDPDQLNALLAEKGIQYLYHANTVATSQTFIRIGGITSRGYVETHDLYQSPQESDGKDKEFGVWNDIFLDTVDLHTYHHRQNKYGPVSYVYDRELVLNPEFEIWITKNNPMYWNANMTDADRYFSSVEELTARWDDYERQRKMMTIRNMNAPLPFTYLDRVVVDDPRVMVDKTVYFNRAVEGIRTALGENTALRNRFQTRSDCTGCYCRHNYRFEVRIPTLNRLFLPR